MDENATKMLAEVAKERSKDVYDDTFKPVAQKTGDLLSLIPETLYSALLPLRKWNLSREAEYIKFRQALEKTVENIPSEKLVAPEPYVAIPALEAVSYSMDREELRDLYTNLLAKSMYEDTKDHVHPMFVEIIKQMSPLDAKVFKIIMERDDNPLIDLVYKRNKDFLTEHEIIMSNISDIDIEKPQIVSLLIDNLAKQNLISISKESFCSNDSVYDKILNSDFYKKQAELHPDKSDGYKFSYDKHTLEVTNIGKAFYEICMTKFH